MIKLIIGKKGSGKTKALIEMVNSALAVTKGSVVCIEKGDKLGGRLHEISCLSFKFDMRRHLQWLMSSTMECGAKIMLNTEATPEIIMGLKPDVVFVATGAERLSLPIPGIDRENVHHVLDVDTGRAAVGERVVVCGGGLSGTESALQLAMDGKKVTVDIVE